MIDNTEIEQVSLDYSPERMSEIALGAIGKIALQDLINDAVLALVELYRAKPEIYRIDTEEYEETTEVQASPFSDLVAYLQEINDVEEDEDESN